MREHTLTPQEVARLVIDKCIELKVVTAQPLIPGTALRRTTLQAIGLACRSSKKDADWFREKLIDLGGSAEALAETMYQQWSSADQRNIEEAAATHWPQ